MAEVGVKINQVFVSLVHSGLNSGEHRRRERLELIQRFATDVAKWPSSKLRDGYAQPETVRKAREREQGEAQNDPRPS
jgi:hypothetical protein